MGRILLAMPLNVGPLARGLEVPVEADSVAGPIVIYGKGPTSINFFTDDARWGRVTFEKLDSIRVSRGEDEPYSRSEGEPHSWVSTVDNSPWLLERYEYEKRYYGNAYEFGGDVDEMLRDFSHYVFDFHDQFVEVISAGIWFETDDEYIGSKEPDSDHPLRDLPESSISHRFEAYGIKCQVRRNPRLLDEIVRNATYCSQNLMPFAAELDGLSSVHWTVSLRVSNGQIRGYLKSYFGKVERQYDGVPTLIEVQLRIEEWLQEVSERRRKMGKA